jgi:virginiamycin B lyase
MTRNVSVLGAIAVACGLTLAPDAGAAVYWTNQAPTGCQGSIGRANVDGSLVDQTFITGADAPNGVAVDATDIYWANTGPCLNSIARANLDGTGVDQSYIAGYRDGPSGPFGIALDDGYLYWANRFGYGSIGTADLAGSNVDETFIPTSSQPCAVAVDVDHVYWANSNTVGRANWDGTGIEPGFIQAADSPCGVVVDGTHVYWTNTGGTTIGRARLDGSQPDQSFITGAGAPCGIAVDGNHVYWGNSATGSIGRANLDGSQADQRFITGATQPCGVAVDSVVVTATPPSNTAVPALNGTPAPGQTLTCSQGSWSGSPVKSYAYQWLRDGSAISVATDSGHAVPAADGGHTLACRVTASNIAGQASATSVRVRIAALPTTTVAPHITGTAAVGRTVWCAVGSWAGWLPRSYSYEWLRDGSVIVAAVALGYTVSMPDAGHTLTCRVTPTDIAGLASATSAGVRVRVPAPKLSVTVPPRVRGTTVVLTLTCTAAVGRRCTSSEALTTTEHRSDTKVLGISSYARPTLASVVTVGRTTFSIAAGRSKVIGLGLNARGRALLERFHKLPGRLTVRLTKGVPRTRVVLSKAVRFSQRKRRA